MSYLYFDECQENEHEQNLWQNLVEVHRTRLLLAGYTVTTNSVYYVFLKGVCLISWLPQVSAFTWVSWARHSLVCLFFRGAVRLRPQRKPRCPKWDLPLVLNFLLEAGIESTRLISIGELSLKSAFLVAITSAKRVYEIAALGCK